MSRFRPQPVRRLPWRIRVARWLVGWHIPRKERS